MTGWHHHPGVKSGDELTLGERAADRMRNGMGSWIFVIGFLVFMGLWMSANSWLFLGHHGKAFDPFPWVLANLFLSLLAGLQGAILLIAAKRQDQIASELAQHDYQTNVAAAADIVATKALATEIHALAAEIHATVTGKGQ